MDLGGAARDDLEGRRVPFDLGVEVIDERSEMGVEQLADRSDVTNIVVGPADVLLQILVAAKPIIRSHDGHFGSQVAAKALSPAGLNGPMSLSEMIVTGLALGG
jgi:hypothetical protein